MNREKIIPLFIEKLENELKVISDIAEKSRQSATDKEFKQEAKYDTRAIEEGYLAGAQAKRVEELKRDLSLLQALTMTSSKEIREGSIIKVSVDEKEQFYLVYRGSGGIKISYDDTEVSTLSVKSKIASEILGLEESDYAVVETPRGEKEFHILEVF